MCFYFVSIGLITCFISNFLLFDKFYTQILLCICPFFNIMYMNTKDEYTDLHLRIGSLSL